MNAANAHFFKLAGFKCVFHRKGGKNEMPTPASTSLRIASDFSSSSPRAEKRRLPQILVDDPPGNRIVVKQDNGSRTTWSIVTDRFSANECADPTTRRSRSR